jgi:putative heme-binding domain-containing protein
LINLLTHENHWFANRARIELASRRDPHALTRLHAMATQTSDVRAALEGLWAIHAIGGFDDSLALKLSTNPAPYIRYWTVRFVGDQKVASGDVAAALAALAATEESDVVRGQLAATAKRLPAEQAVPIVAALLRHSPNDSDPRVPWLIWWAIESKAASDADYLVGTFGTREMWANPGARENNLRLIRRFAAEGTSSSYDACSRMIESAPKNERVEIHGSLRQGLAERAVGLQGIGQGELFVDQATGGNVEPAAEIRKYQPLTGPLREYIDARWREQPDNDATLQLALQAGIDGAQDKLASDVLQPGLPPDRRVQLLRLLREFNISSAASQLVQFVLSNEPEQVRIAALDVLAGIDDGNVARELLDAYPNLSASLQSRVRDALASRPATALALLQQVDAGAISASDIPLDQLRRVALHSDNQIDALMRKHWGNIGPGTAEEKLAIMRRYNNDLRVTAGDPHRGKEVFAKSCAICHQLNGEGNKIGADLTTANRQDRAALLGNIVDPSAVVRREYMSYVVTTTSGRVYSGLIAEQDGATITVLDAKNERLKIPREEIDTLDESGTSLMPERILDELTSAQIRDLFAYLESAPAK